MLVTVAAFMVEAPMLVALVPVFPVVMAIVIRISCNAQDCQYHCGYY